MLVWTGMSKLELTWNETMAMHSRVSMSSVSAFLRRTSLKSSRD